MVQKYVTAVFYSIQKARSYGGYIDSVLDPRLDFQVHSSRTGNFVRLQQTCTMARLKAEGIHPQTKNAESPRLIALKIQLLMREA